MVSRQPILYHLYILIQVPYQHSQRPWRHIRFEIYVRRVRMLTRRDRTLILMMPVVFHKNVDVDVWEILKRYQFDLQFRFMNPNHKPENVSSINTDITKIPRNTYHCVYCFPLYYKYKRLKPTEHRIVQNDGCRKVWNPARLVHLRYALLKGNALWPPLVTFVGGCEWEESYLSILSKIRW